MALSKDQKKRFHEDGYLVIPGVVPRQMIDRALQTINHDIGQNGIHPDLLDHFRSNSYCKEVQGHPSLKQLTELTMVRPIFEDLFGEGQVAPMWHAQIALRFPRPVDSSIAPPSGHLDGLGSGKNGSAQGEYKRSFAALCVILLSDLPEPDSGNFTVWPGSHQFFEGWLRENGVEILGKGQPSAKLLPHGPVQITGKAGDICITHHQLFHTAAPNTSPHVRYAAIYRVNSLLTKEFGNAAYTDIWHEWPGIRALWEDAPAKAPETAKASEPATPKYE